MSDAAVGPSAVPAKVEPAQSEKIAPKTLKKLIPLGMMFFCILFNYTILR
jgi:ATP:ADP antiporter, AAA family